jgi:hypothetical protein
MPLRAHYKQTHQTNWLCFARPGPCSSLCAFVPLCPCLSILKLALFCTEAVAPASRDPELALLCQYGSPPAAGLSAPKLALFYASRPCSSLFPLCLCASVPLFLHAQIGFVFPNQAYGTPMPARRQGTTLRTCSLAHSYPPGFQACLRFRRLTGFPTRSSLSHVLHRYKTLAEVLRRHKTGKNAKNLVHPDWLPTKPHRPQTCPTRSSAGAGSTHTKARSHEEKIVRPPHSVILVASCEIKSFCYLRALCRAVSGSIPCSLLRWLSGSARNQPLRL